MASFTEQATLRVIDQSSAQLRKINAELKKLFTTAKSLKSIKIDININTGKLSAANQQINAIARNLGNLGRHSRSINVDTSKLATANQQVNKLAASLTKLHSQRINLNANTSGITQAQSRLNALRTSAARPFTMGSFVGGGLIGQAAGAAARGTWRATKEGTTQVDVGQTNIEMLQLGKGGYADRPEQAKKAIDEVMKTLSSLPGPQQFNRGLVSQRFAESLLQVREGEAAEAWRPFIDKAKPWLGTRPASADEMRTESIKRMQQAQLRTAEELNIADLIAKRSGISPEQAITKVAGYFKALDQAGALTDNLGDFDSSKLEAGGNLIRRMIGMVGEEATGRFMHTLYKREKGAKYTLSERGQLTAAIIAEDMDPATAGTALASWMRQTQGKGTKESMAERAAAGLMTPIYGPQTYDRKGRPKKRKITGYDAKGAELAMTDPVRYGQEYLVPALQKMGISLEEIYSSAEKDVTKVKAALDKLHSNTNAAAFAQTLIVKGDEINKQIIDAYTRDASQQASREASQFSVGAAMNTITGQFKGMMGEAVVAFAKPIGYVAEGLGEFFRKGGAEIRRIHDEGDWGAIPGFVAGAGATALAGGAGYWAIRKAMEATGAGQAIGWSSGMMAMMSDNEGMRALGGAGVSLIEAAGALKDAAATLSGNPALGNIDPTVGPDGKPRTGKTPPPKTGPGRLSRLGSWISSSAQKVGGAVVTAATVAIATVKKNPTKFMKGAGWLTAGAIAWDVGQFIRDLPDDAATRVERNENRQKIAALMRTLPQERANLARMIQNAGANPTARQKSFLDKEAARLRQKEAELNRRLIQYEATQFSVEQSAKKTVPTVKVTPDQMPKNMIRGSAPIVPSELRQAVTDGVGDKPIRTVSVSAADMPTGQLGTTPIVPSTGGFTPAAGTTPPPAPSTTAEALVALIPQLAKTSESITTAVTGLNTAGTNFATAFSTAATSIGNAGQTAVNTLNGAAASIGSAIGKAAASAISQATVQVNVNNPGAAAPKGDLATAN